MRPLLYILVICSSLTGFADDRILLDAKINDQPVRLAFDSGFGAGICIWRNVAQQLSLAIESPPADLKPAPGEIAVAKTAPAKVDLCGRTFPNIRISVLDYPPYMPMEIQGLVGWESVKHQVFEVRVASGLMATHDRIPEGTNTWLKMPVRTEQAILVLSLPETGHRVGGTVLIDTG